VGNVDVLRAGAALAVVAGHAYVLSGRAVPVKAQYWYDVPIITTATGVWLFFGISGYVITRPFVDRLLQDRPLPASGPYLLRRALRIFPLYWLALTAVIVITGAPGTAAWQFPVHYLLLNNLVSGREEALFSVAWTLTLEVIFYLVVPLLAVAVSRWRPRLSAERLALLVIGSWLASIAFTAVADLHGDDKVGLWLRGSFPAMWQMFCPGILLAIAPHVRADAGRRWLVELPRRPAGIALMAALLIPAAVLAAAAPLGGGVVVYQLLVDATRPLFALGFGIAIAAAIASRPWGGSGRTGRWLLALGLVSYGIYLLHAVLLTLFLDHRGAVPARTTSTAAYALHIALLAAVTVPLAIISWRWLEQPLIALGRRPWRTAPR
jgi:peptidoglycan/LPS O-acetylase OafA/YrhL